MLKLKWFSIFRLCCLILYSLFDLPCLLPLEQCIVMCNIFHGEVNQLIDVSTSYFHFLLLLPFSTLTQLSKYLCEVEDHSLTSSATSKTLDFWIQREHVYDKLSLVAEDILAAPASQAYTLNVYFQFGDCWLRVVEIEWASHCKCERA